jgi:hypothetical protein
VKPAGRERDKVIARWLGLELVNVPDECSGFEPGSRWVGGSEYYEVDHWYAVPPDQMEQFEQDNDERLFDLLPYSTDNAAALELADVELPKRGWRVEIHINKDAEGYGMSRHVLCKRSDDPRIPFGMADTLADAITACVLQIVEAEEAKP